VLIFPGEENQPEFITPGDILMDPVMMSATKRAEIGRVIRPSLTSLLDMVLVPV